MATLSPGNPEREIVARAKSQARTGQLTSAMVPSNESGARPGPSVMPAARAFTALQRLGGNRALSRMLQPAHVPDAEVTRENREIQRMNNPGSDDDDEYNFVFGGGKGAALDEDEEVGEEEAGPTPLEQAFAFLRERIEQENGKGPFVKDLKLAVGQFELKIDFNELRDAFEAANPEQAPAAEKQPWTKECDAVWNHMQAMYAKANPNPKPRKNGSFPLQSAYFGSDKINNDNGAEKLKISVINELKKRVVGTTWYFDSSDSSGASFKRPIQGSKIKPWNFLYKTRPPI